jgi:ribosome-associated translation inhibitor RaiA
MMPVDVTAAQTVPRQDLEGARTTIGSLDRYIGHPPTASPRLTLRREGSRKARRRYVADASLLFDGRLLAAHAAASTAREAADEVADRLRRQVRRVVDADVALRNDPRVIEDGLDALEAARQNWPEARLKPPEEREIVHRRTYADHPEATLEAIADMLDVDEEFHLFWHVRTGEDVVVYRRDDGRIGLIHPRGSILADENDIVFPQPSRYTEPLTLDTARAEMDLLDHRFLYFVDAQDGRGKVLYLRHDGDYGLVEPE